MQKFENLRGKAFAFLLFITFIWFISYTTRTIFAPVLPFVEDEFGVTHARASSIFLFSSIGYGLSVFMAGVFGRLLGLKKSMMACLFLAALACLAIPFYRSFPLFYLSTFFIGVSQGLYLPSAVPFLTSYFDNRKWGKVLAIHDSGVGTALFATPLIVTGLLMFISWRGIFLAMAATMMLCAIILGVVAEDKKGPSGAAGYFGGVLWKKKELWYLGVIGSFITGAGIGFYYVIPLYLVKELGIPSSQANAILGVSRIGSIVAGILTGFVVDRISIRKTMFLLALGAEVSTAFLATKNLTWIRILFVIQPICVMSFMPCLFLAVSTLFDDHLRGQATGVILTLASIIGAGIIPYLLGVSGDLVSFRLGIFLLGIGTVLCSVFLLPLKRLR